MDGATNRAEEHTAMDILFEILTFAAKGLVVFLTVVACLVVFFGLTRRGRERTGHIEVKRLNDHIKDMREAVRHSTMGPAGRKAHRKRLKRELKKPDNLERNLFVLDFRGDMLASDVDHLREEVSALLSIAGQNDEVVVRLESPGGVVPNYGLAAAQLRRLRDANIRLTVCVDRIAASGGYMMACVAHEVLAAPFAIIGSIGVIAPVPNVHSLLRRYGIDYQEMTAGEFKRTVSLFGEITDKGRRRFQEQLEETHTVFKDFIRTNRPELSVDEVATGEYWLASRALELGLVDRLSTSDDHLVSKLDQANILEVKYKQPQSIRERLSEATTHIAERVSLRLIARLSGMQHG